MFEIDKVNDHNRFFLELLNIYSDYEDDIFIHFSKGINIKLFVKLLFKLKGKFINASLVPILPVYFFKIDRFSVLLIKEQYFKNLKWIIINVSKNVSLAFNHHNSSKPIIEVHSEEEKNLIINLLNAMIKKNVITGFSIITDDN
jgi:hypothetical protein